MKHHQKTEPKLFKQNGRHMKSTLLIFFSIVLGIYALVNFYLLRRGWQALTSMGELRYVFLFIFLLLIVAYPLGRWMERLYCCGFTKAFVLVGSFYLGFMVYAFLLTVLVDAIRGIESLGHILPAVFTRNSQLVGGITALTIVMISALTLLGGYLNAIHPRVKTLRLEIPKSAGNLKRLNIVLASDIHLGTIIRNSRLQKIISTINSLQPDLVLFPGDVVDEDIAPVIEQNMAESFRGIHATYGAFAITGNHEYFGGVEQAVRYIQEGNVTVLQDSVVKIADAFYLIGRKDLMARRYGSGRKPLETLVAPLRKSLPLILMDHQPFQLEEAQRNGIDLQFSGHTHHGQMFPFNLITKKVYEQSWGYLRKGNTQYYVSCGVGTWGPPIRIGNTPEIVQIILQFR